MTYQELHAKIVETLREDRLLPNLAERAVELVEPIGFSQRMSYQSALVALAHAAFAKDDPHYLGQGDWDKVISKTVAAFLTIVRPDLATVGSIHVVAIKE